MTVNVFFGVITFVAGWMLKIIFGLFNKLQDDYRSMNDKIVDKQMKTQEDLVSLALSMPEKYLRKDDFRIFTDRMNERFDKVEEKLDKLQ